VTIGYARLQTTQHSGERLIAETSRRLRKFAYREVGLLLAGARLAEGYVPDLYRRRPRTGITRPATHPTLPPFIGRPDQEILSQGGATALFPRYYDRTKSLQGRSEQRIHQKEDIIPRPLVGKEPRNPFTGVLHSHHSGIYHAIARPSPSVEMT